MKLSSYTVNWLNNNSELLKTEDLDNIFYEYLIALFRSSIAFKDYSQVFKEFFDFLSDIISVPAATAATKSAIIKDLEYIVPSSVNTFQLTHYLEDGNAFEDYIKYLLDEIMIPDFYHEYVNFRKVVEQIIKEKGIMGF